MVVRVQVPLAVQRWGMRAFPFLLKIMLDTFTQKIRIAGWLIILLACALPAAARHVRFYGYVLGVDNRSIEFANVYWKESINHANGAVGTTTNKNGYYDIRLDTDDSITLVYSLMGYQTLEIRMLPDREIINVNVVLEPESQELKEISVSAIRHRDDRLEHVEGATRRVIPDAGGGNIESLLITFAGVSQNNEMSSQYNVRGGNFDENSVYVNGMEIHRPLLIRAGQQEGLSFVNTDMVEAVSFSAGGFDARYGDKMASVLDIRYKRPTALEASVSAGFHGGSLFIGHGNERFSQMHGFRYKSSQYMLGSLQTAGNYKPHFFDYQTMLNGKVGNWNISFLGNYSRNSYGFTPDSSSVSWGGMNAKKLTIYYNGQEKDLFQTAFAALSAHGKVSEEVKIGFDLSGFYTNEQETYDILGQYILSEAPMDGTQASGQRDNTIINDSSSNATVLGKGTYMEHARNTLQAGVVTMAHAGEWKHLNNTLRWGASLQGEWIHDHISEWEWRDSMGYSIPNTDRDMQLYYAMRGDTTRKSLRMQSYIEDTYRWNTTAGKVILTGGVRFHYWTLNREPLVSPRASVVFVPGWKRDFSFRLSTGLYYQAPFYKELRDTVTDAYGITRIALNNSIKAQRSTHVVLGADYYFRAMGRPFKLTAEAYFKYLDRGVSYTVDNVRVRYSGENDMKGYTVGLDLKLYGELVPGADSWISFSTMRSREMLINHPELGWRPPPQEQRYGFSMLFQDYLPQLPQLRAHIKFIWNDGLPFGYPRNINSRGKMRMSSYKRIDLGFTHVSNAMTYNYMKRSKHIKEWTVQFEVFNLVGWKNVNSFFWVTDANDIPWASPNYLTGRRYNLKLTVDFK